MAASGVSAVVSLALVVVGFLLATAVVIALARASTARWERDKRAAVAIRAGGSTRWSPPSGSGPAGLIATTRSGLAAVRGRASRFTPVAVLARVLPERARRPASAVRPIRRLVRVLRPSLDGGRSRLGRWTRSRAPAVPVDGDTGEPALAPERTPAATDVRADGVAGAAGRRLLRRTVPRGRRRALAFLHRHEGGRAPHVPQEDRDESPSARQ